MNSTNTTTSFPAINTTGAYNHSYSVETLIMSATSCSLSIFGGVVIFVTFVVLPEIRNFTRKLVICLTVADLITAAAYLVSVIRYVNIRRGPINYSEESILCKTQSFFTTYSSLVSFFLTSIIAVYIFDTVVNRSDRLGTTAWLVVFNVISWLIPGISSVYISMFVVQRGESMFIYFHVSNNMDSPLRISEMTDRHTRCNRVCNCTERNNWSN